MIIVMGLPGAGKTTVLEGLNTDYKIQNYGDLMFEIEKENYGIKDRDEMRGLPIEKQKEVQKEVSKRLSSETGKFILDTHCSVKTDNGYYPGLPFDFLSGLKVDVIVLITADPNEIAERRKGDPSRTRDEQSAEKIAEHDFMNKAYLAAYSAFLGAPSVIIHNKQGKVEDAVATLQKLLV